MVFTILWCRVQNDTRLFWGWKCFISRHPSWENETFPRYSYILLWWYHTVGFETKVILMGGAMHESIHMHNCHKKMLDSVGIRRMRRLRRQLINSAQQSRACLRIRVPRGLVSQTKCSITPTWGAPVRIAYFVRRKRKSARSCRQYHTVVIRIFCQIRQQSQLY